MNCPTCSIETAHIKVVGDTIGCHSCMNFSETGGSKTDKILSYSADRITEQQIQHEGDMISPYVVDKSTNQVVVNEDFIDKYPNQAVETFSREELDSAGYTDLKATENDDTGEGIEFKGEAKEAIKEIVKAED